MRWQDCIRINEIYVPGSRWKWPSDGDFNCIPGTTISDMTGAIQWLLTYPGDAVLNLEGVRTFLELPYPVVGHWLSYALLIAGVVLVVFALTLAFAILLALATFVGEVIRTPRAVWLQYRPGARGIILSLVVLALAGLAYLDSTIPPRPTPPQPIGLAPSPSPNVPGPIFVRPQTP